jgi:hypothetical protein
MAHGMARAPLSLLGALGFVCALALAPVLSQQAAIAAKGTSSTPQFGHEVVVDHQRVAGEPSLSLSPVLNGGGFHDIYVSAPFGFSTSASFVWKSEDGGQTFHLIGDETPPSGKPASTCAGGGDSSIVNDTAGNLYFSDLQGLTNVSDSVSTDGGNTFVTTCNTANDVGVDRPWLSTFGDPLTTGREYMTVDQVSQCIDNCGLGQAGSNMLELTQTSGLQAQSQAYAPLPAQQIEPDGIVSGTVVNQSNGDLYIVHTGLTDNNGTIIGGGDANGNTNAIVVDRFPGGYSQSTATPVPPTSISLCSPYDISIAAPCQSETAFHAPLTAGGNSTVTTGQDFSPMAIDSAGNLYVVWSQASVDPSSGQINGPSTVYMATSTNNGVTWSAPINVGAHVGGLQTNLFPAVAAGSAGHVDIAWYGTSTLGSCPNQPCGSGAINGQWNVYMAQTLNAVTSTGPNASPSFTTTKVSEYSNHYGAICTMGIGCTTGGDRGLADFIQVQVEPSGAADVVWADSANTDFQGESSALIAFAHQVGGQGLYGTTVSGPTPLLGSAPGSPASYFAGNFMEAPANSNVDITNSSVTESKNDQYYKVTMQVGNLNSLLANAALGGTDLVWLTRWELPTTSPTATNQGHIFYAAMESDGGGTPSFYDGETTCGVTEVTHCKYLAYPSQHAVTGSYTASGTITITVPIKDAGASPDRELFSVTGATGTQTAPASSGSAIFNVIDSTPPYDVIPG